MVAKRKYEPRETRLINEWVKGNYPEALQWRLPRLGPIPGTEGDKYYKGLRRWCDYVIFVKDTVFIIEAKMRPKPEGLAELEVYDRLFPKTPEFKELWNKPRKLVYLTTKHDDIIAELSAEKNIEFVVYAPEWVKEWWIERMEKGR